MNFGTILNSVTKTCVTMMIESKDKESKKLAKDFIKYVQLKEILSTQFRVFQQLNSSYIKDKDSAKVFVTETFSMLERFFFEDILSYNHLVESKFNITKADSTDLNMDISKVIRYLTSENSHNQEEYVNSIDRIVEHVSTFRAEKDILSDLSEAASSLKILNPKHIVRIALKKFNDKYALEFDDEDRVIFETLRVNDMEKLTKMYLEKTVILERLSKDLESNFGEALASKVFEAVNGIKSGYTQENFLNTHELVSELSKLKEEL